MKVAVPLAKNVLAPLGISDAMSAVDGSIKMNDTLIEIIYFYRNG